jgi:cytosine/adenosine deaminase-related metal-dependent hydrolase
MSDEQKFYGLEGWKRLEDSVASAVERALDEAWEETSDCVPGLTWPVRVIVYRHAKLATPEKLGRIALDALMEHLDEEYGDPDGCGPDKPTEAMRAAATALGKAVREGYAPWACVPTGDVIEVTLEQAREMLGEDKP